jgi:DNA-binding transcriptional LysR family regulator
MNVHHLELFYYVAKHRGISQAARHMPYGIQQPAISGQLRRLEEELGLRLFERTPFRLTAEGGKLLEFIEPFFGRLDTMAKDLRSSHTPVLHLGAAEVALRDHVPGIVRQLRRRFPGMQLKMRDGLQGQLAEWVEAGELDVAIVALGRRPPPRLKCRRLLRIPLVLLVPAKGTARSAESWWRPDAHRLPLIGLPASETVTASFQDDLRRRCVRWPVAVEANSLSTITQYVAQGQGVGVSLDVPGLVRQRGVRACPLPGFAPLEIAALWRDEPTPLVAAFVDEAARHIARDWPGRAVAAK